MRLLLLLVFGLIFAYIHRYAVCVQLGEKKGFWHLVGTTLGYSLATSIPLVTLAMVFYPGLFLGRENVKKLKELGDEGTYYHWFRWISLGALVIGYSVFMSEVVRRLQ